MVLYLVIEWFLARHAATRRQQLPHATSHVFNVKTQPTYHAHLAILPRYTRLQRRWASPASRWGLPLGKGKTQAPPLLLPPDRALQHIHGMALATRRYQPTERASHVSRPSLAANPYGLSLYVQIFSFGLSIFLTLGFHNRCHDEAFAFGKRSEYMASAVVLSARVSLAVPWDHGLSRYPPRYHQCFVDSHTTVSQRGVEFRVPVRVLSLVDAARQHNLETLC
ncbi:hypothetical protein ABW21_db0200356 [Orbilia brochopaga]|nr:hypothetical protein ABW21_db0200356 [Drechslerella brochopaga]